MRLYDDLPGGEAFPSHPEAGVQRHFIARGMSLRDYFAAALHGLLASGREYDAEQFALSAFGIADAMLEERK